MENLKSNRRNKIVVSMLLFLFTYSLIFLGFVYLGKNATELINFAYIIFSFVASFLGINYTTKTGGEKWFQF